MIGGRVMKIGNTGKK